MSSLKQFDPRDQQATHGDCDQTTQQSPSSIRWWRPKYAVSSIAIFAVLTVAVALILLLHPTLSSCLNKSINNPWGTGEIHVCASNGQGSYSGSTHTTDKTADGYYVRWRIVWDNKPDTYALEACWQGSAQMDVKGLAGVSGVTDAFFERVQDTAGTGHKVRSG
jgi:hypothetical protein